MIRKILMKNAASYKHNEAILQTDRKINYIYGLNGVGKSTLSSFLYSPSNKLFEHCSIEKDADNEVLVYNENFVRDNFHSSDGLPGIFTLSKENKDILVQIQVSEEKKEYLNQKIEENKKEQGLIGEKINLESQKVESSIWKIKETFYGGDRVLDFCLKGHIGSKKDLLKKILATSVISNSDVTIANLKKEAQEILGDAQKLPSVPKVNLSLDKIEKHTIFSKEIVGNNNSSISNFIQDLGNADWVRKGLTYVSEESTSEQKNSACPFCQNLTISRELLKSIGEYFDVSYEKDLSLLKDLRDQYETLLTSLPQDSAFLNHPKMDNSPDFRIKYQELRTLMESNLSLIKEKLRSPSSRLNLKSSDMLVVDLNAIIEEANRETDLHNVKIEKKDEVSLRIKDEFWGLMRFEQNKLIEEYLNSEKELTNSLANKSKEFDEIQRELQNVKDQISALQKKTTNIEEAVQNINSHLKDMGVINLELIKHGEGQKYKIQREGRGSDIYKSLSEGEKTVITFLYFLEFCKGRKNPEESEKKKVIVIDDPISSLSHMYIFNVGRLIKNEFLGSDKFEQFFILTHNLYFFYELANAKSKPGVELPNLYRIIKNTDGSKIVPMKINEIQNDYQSYWSVLKDPNIPETLLANSMRNILEHFFGFVEKHESLNNIFQQKIFQENKFQSFVRYMDRGSHSDAINISDFKDINHEFFKEAFKMVFDKTGYSDHYMKMMR